MTHKTLTSLSEEALIQHFSDLVGQDRATTAAMLACIAEIDERKVYLKHACSSMFAFCVERFHMSEAIAYKRIRAGRVASRFPRILGMVERGELHLGAVHLLASHLTETNHNDVLDRARHRTVRQIEHLIAEIAPKPDVPSRIVTLPTRKPTKQVRTRPQHDTTTKPSPRTSSRFTPLSPRRYRMQVTMSQETHDKLTELQELMSHQIPDGDLAEIVDRALDLLLDKMRKQKAALTDKPRKSAKRKEKRTRGIPARVQRSVFRRDKGRCAFVDEKGNRCSGRRFIEFHHKVPYALGGVDDIDNIELRCRAHNQYEANVDYGELFMTMKRTGERRPDPKGQSGRRLPALARPPGGK